MQRFCVHAEWKEREPGKLLPVRREATVEISGNSFNAVMHKAKQRFPVAQISYKVMPEKATG